MLYLLDCVAVIWVWLGGFEKMKSCLILFLHPWVSAVTDLSRGNPPQHEA